MKVTINIDCTPQEARSFLGLPDLEPVHDEALAALRGRVIEAIENVDAEVMLKSWMPEGMKGFEEMQKAFWTGMTGREPGGTRD